MLSPKRMESMLGCMHMNLDLKLIQESNDEKEMVEIMTIVINSNKRAFDDIDYDYLTTLTQKFSKPKESVMRLMLEEFTNSSKWCYGCSLHCCADQENNNYDIKLVGEVINWLTDHQLPTLYQRKSSKIFPIRELFFLAVLDCQIKLAKVLWKNLEGDFIATALMASSIMKSVAQKLDKRKGMYYKSRKIPRLRTGL